MYFKRLEVYGFKSFADKTSIEINDGITCIVGPNGSGKSNFSDAIKWVLGEQRPSELRAKNMKDVIFNGTERRGSMSYCEVALVFDNSDRFVFPTLEFDEVVIARKLYRNGDSEYSLNRNVCKLKQINDLISDTGLGKAGFSIIGQGQVAKIIASKPEDRRSIFEEAAGISKYKKRKKEAEQNLAATKEHLNRFCDIIKEIDRTLPKLREQSEDAKKFLEYHAALKHLEVNHYLYTFENNKHVKVKIDEKIKGLNEEIAQIQRDIDKLDKDYFNTTVEQQKNDDAIDELKNSQTAFMLEKERMQGRTNVLTERLEAINRDIVKTKANIDRMLAQVEDKNHQIAKIEEKNSLIREELAIKQSEYDATDEEYTKIVDEIIAREHELEASSKSILEGMAKLVDVHADKSKLAAERDYSKERLVEANYFIDKDKRQIEENEETKRKLNTESQAAKSARDKSYADRISTRNAVNDFKLKEQLLTKEVGDLTQSITGLNAKRDILNKIKNDYDSYNSAVKKLMEECKIDFALNKKVLGVVAELLKVDEKYEVAVEVALGANLQHIAATSEDDVKYIIEVLKRKRFGRLTVLPIDVMRPRLIEQGSSVIRESGCMGVAAELISYEPKFKNLFANLLGSTLVFDSYDNAMRVAKKYNRQYRLVTLEGELIAPGGAITGGSRRSDSSSILSQDRELEKITALLKKYEAEIKSKNNLLKAAKEGYESNYLKLQDIDTNLQQLEIEYVKASEREEQLENVIEGLLAHMSEYCTKRDEYDARIKVLDGAIANVEKLSGDITDNQASVDGDNSKSKELFEARKRQKDELLERRENLKLIIAEHTLTLDNSQLDIARLNEEIDAVNSAIEEDKGALAALQDNAKLAEGAILKTNLTDRDRVKLDKIAAEIKLKEDYKRQLNAHILEINDRKNQLNLRDRDVRGEQIRQDNAIDKLNAQMIAMTERLREEYEIDHDKAVEMRDENFDDTDAAQEIANYKRKITNLGVVNVAAIEEYQTEGKRYEEMAEQRDDLLKSESELLELIAELSNEMKNKFDSEFEKIAKNFTVTFKEIFGGGSGELVVDTQAEDPLEAGIDIIVQAPGKKRGALQLLSGGEMALTAIAILFAILKTRPMPFCILDEIEAALDESNARLFAKYLKRFVADTQFIVITHRKPTMEQADRLYGVTMEEKGVSKVVSVELNEANSLVEEKKKKIS